MLRLLPSISKNAGQFLDINPARLELCTDIFAQSAADLGAKPPGQRLAPLRVDLPKYLFYLLSNHTNPETTRALCDANTRQASLLDMHTTPVNF